jgi:hypothetical protein
MKSRGAERRSEIPAQPLFSSEEERQAFRARYEQPRAST